MGARPVLAFEANAPTVIALAFAEGLPTKSKFGPDQVMYSLQEPPEHVMFIAADVAQKIRQLDPAPGERFVLCKRKGAERNSAVRWDVWLSPESEKARAARESGVPVSDNGRPAWGANAPVTVTVEDPSDLERQLEASLADVRRKKAEAAAQRVAVAVAEPEPAPMAWTALLLEHTNALTDCYAAARNHANTYGDDDVTAAVEKLLVTAFINLAGKKGRS